jgi:hypothetical protein
MREYTMSGAVLAYRHLVDAESLGDFRREIRRHHVRLVHQLPEHIQSAGLLQVERYRAFAIVDAEIKVVPGAGMRIGNVHHIGAILGQDAKGSRAGQDLCEVKCSHTLQRITKCATELARGQREPGLDSHSRRSSLSASSSWRGPGATGGVSDIVIW